MSEEKTEITPRSMGGIIKGLLLNTSTDVTRPSLMGIFCECNEDHTVDLTTTDGHTLMHVPGIPKGVMEEYIIQETGAAFALDYIENGCLLFLDNKTRKKVPMSEPVGVVEENGVNLTYPKWHNVVPSAEFFNCLNENYPCFGYETMARAKKILGNNSGFFPEKWGSRTGACIKDLAADDVPNFYPDASFLLVMPMRHKSRGGGL